MTTVTLGAPISSSIARFFSLEKSLQVARTADADIQERAARITNLADAAAAELIAAMHDISAFEHEIAQGRLF